MKQELLNTKFLQARKENNTVAKNLLGTLKGEFENQLKLGKETPDAILERLASKMTENARVINTDESRQEIEVLKDFMPAMLSIDEINTFVSTVISESNGNKNVNMLFGNFMKLAKPTGKKVDANVVKELIGNILK